MITLLWDERIDMTRPVPPIEVFESREIISSHSIQGKLSTMSAGGLFSIAHLTWLDNQQKHLGYTAQHVEPEFTQTFHRHTTLWRLKLSKADIQRALEAAAGHIGDSYGLMRADCFSFAGRFLRAIMVVANIPEATIVRQVEAVLTGALRALDGSSGQCEMWSRGNESIASAVDTSDRATHQSSRNINDSYAFSEALAMEIAVGPRLPANLVRASEKRHRSTVLVLGASLFAAGVIIIFVVLVEYGIWPALACITMFLLALVLFQLSHAVTMVGSAEDAKVHKE